MFFCSLAGCGQLRSSARYVQLIVKGYAAMPIITLLVLVYCALFVTEIIGAFLWSLLPFSKGTSSIAFTLFSAILLTPVPVDVGVGAMIYPIFVLYKDVAYLKWHLHWYADEPVLVAFVAFSFIVTCALAYIASYRLVPKKARS